MKRFSTRSIISIIAILLILAMLIIYLTSGTSLISNSTKNNIINVDNLASKYTHYSQGVVGYGLYSIKHKQTYGTLVPSNTVGIYQVVTNAMFGCVNISSISSYVSHHSQVSSKYSASLQFNLNLVLNTTTNTPYTYWLQDVMVLNTSAEKYLMIDSITNTSNTNNPQISTSTVKGNGDPTSLEIITGNATTYANNLTYTMPSYEYIVGRNERLGLDNLSAAKPTDYVLPMEYCPVINVNTSGRYPVVQFGYYINNTGIFYDNVTFLVPSKSVHLLVTPLKIVPNGKSLYDAEFVFGGPVNGDNATFTNINASQMWMFYDSNGSFEPFPSLYSSAWNTNERATNLEVSQGNTGYAEVKIGQDNLFSDMILNNSTYPLSSYSNVKAWIKKS
jgi:hypothetical protein